MKQRKRGPYKIQRHAVVQPQNPLYKLIPLTRNQNALVDAADYEWLNKWNWIALWDSRACSFYALRRGGISMHRTILSCGPDEEGDHKNHDTLDNRRDNFRKCTQQQNKCNKRKARNNTSGFKGVVFRKSSRKWRAYISCNKIRIWLGSFDSAECASKAYDEAAKRLHGQFAFDNHSCTE